jgi:hypothetical protein
LPGSHQQPISRDVNVWALNEPKFYDDEADSAGLELGLELELEHRLGIFNPASSAYL